jgi:tetratricopeptide (TPR) repeat protein
MKSKPTAALILSFFCLSGSLVASTWESEVQTAAALALRGDYTAAESRLRQSLSLAKSEDQTATTWNNLGAVLVDLGRLPEAESAFRRSLQVWTKYCGKDCPSSAYPLNSLGGLLIDLGHLHEAELFLNESLALRRRFPEALDPSPTLSNLALLSLTKRDYRAAEKSLLELLVACPANKAHCLATNVTAHHNLALALAGQKRTAESVDAFRRAIQLGESLYGPRHPKLGWTFLECASALVKAGELVPAEPLYKTVLEIGDSAGLGPHPLIYRAMEEYGALQMRLHHKPEAQALRKQARQLRSLHEERLRASAQAIHIDSLRARR